MRTSRCIHDFRFRYNAHNEHSDAGRILSRLFVNEVPVTLSPIREREHLVEDSCRTAIERNGILMALTGHSGAGKTWMLREISGRMHKHSPVHFATADEFEKDESFSFFERLLSLSDAPTAFVDPQVQPMALARDTLSWMTRPGRPALQTIILDDVQWIDADSQRVLRYLAPRILRKGYFIAVAGRSEMMSAKSVRLLDELAASNPWNRVEELRPLSVEEIRSLARDRLQTSISADIAEKLRNVTGGSFLGLESIFEQITPAERTSLHRLWDIPVRGVDPNLNPLLAGYRSLSPTARTSVEIVSVADSELTTTDIGLAARQLGEDIDTATAVDQQLLSVSGFGSTVIPRHTLIAHAVRQCLSPERAQSIYRALAPLTHGFRSIQYSLRGADTWSTGLAATVEDYVAEALDHTNIQNISEVLRGCLELAEGEERNRLLERLALINMRHKTVFSIIDLLPDYVALPDGALKECIVITMQVIRTDLPFPHDRMRRFLAVDTPDPDTRTLQGYVAFLSVIEFVRTTESVSLGAAIAKALAIIDGVPSDPAEVDARLRWMMAREESQVLFECYGVIDSQRSDDSDSSAIRITHLVARVEALPPSSYKVDALVPLAAIAVAIGEIELAHRLAAEGARLLYSVEKPWAGGTIRVILAHCLSLTGTLPQAMELVQVADAHIADAVDFESRLVLLGLHAWLAEATGADGVIDLDSPACQLEGLSWEPYTADMLVLAQAERARVRGDSAAVLRATAEDRVNALVTTQHGGLTYRVHALIDEFRLEEASELIERLARMFGTQWQEYWGTLAWARARLAQALSDESAASVSAVVTLYESAISEDRFPLPRALTLRDFGEFLISTGDVGSARTALLRAQKIIAKIGAKPYAERIGELLRSVPLHNRGLLDTLTAREKEISTMVAEGMSNSEIAKSLFVSPATVRYHVSNLLRKLNLSRRSEVAGLIHNSQASYENSA